MFCHRKVTVKILYRYRKGTVMLLVTQNSIERVGRATEQLQFGQWILSCTGGIMLVKARRVGSVIETIAEQRHSQS